MSDLLASASLLLGIVTIIFGLWYPEIKSALELKISDYPEDYDEDYPLVRNTLFFRSFPLAISSVILFLIFIPDALKIIYLSFCELLNFKIYRYDAVKTAFVFVVFLFLYLSINLVYWTHKLWKMAKILSKKK